MKGKAKNLASIEELDRLVPLLKEAIAVEVSQKLGAVRAEIEAAAAVGAASKAAEEVNASPTLLPLFLATFEATARCVLQYIVLQADDLSALLRNHSNCLGFLKSNRQAGKRVRETSPVHSSNPPPHTKFQSI